MVHNLTSAFLLTLLFLSPALSQPQDYASVSLNENLTQNADAVIRFSETSITITAYNKMTEKIKRVVTVLNSNGDKHVDAYAFYDSTTKIKKVQATVFDKHGVKIKTIKKNDFIDISAVDAGTMYSDHRVKYLDYTAIAYPYTVEFISEVESTTTAFITSWLPLENYRVSTEFSKYEITNNSGKRLKTKKRKFEDYDIQEISEYSMVANNLKALKKEVYSEGLRNMVPYMRVALEVFDMKGVKGTNKNWKDFGKWVNDMLINDTRTLPQNVIDEVKAKIPETASKLEKAKIVYQYMQNKTRYVSVQIGIGGWRPIIAEEVNQLGYGDCKGLSNYTKALLESVGVPSYYAIIYGGYSIRSLDENFSSTQGNHAVLAIPHKDDYVWLECTSQTSPFGYTANFTDDRDALLITPDGGKIVHTKVYEALNNKRETSANVALSTEGNLIGDVTIITEGAPYEYHASIENKSVKDQKLTYKENYWEDINRLNIENISLTNDKDSIRFTEKVKFNAVKYAKISGEELMFSPNFFGKLSYVPPKNKNRISDVKINRGYINTDEYFLKIPETSDVLALPNSKEIISEFGSYNYSVTQKEEHLIHVKRELVINKGQYDAEQYNNYRDFRKAIAKADKSVLILKLNQL